MRTTNASHRNWSGSVRWTPAEVLLPTSEDEVLAALHRARRTGRTVRVVGGGHSFSALVATDGMLLSLDSYQGLVRADTGTGLVTLRGGTRLWEIADLLAPHDLALAVMGDIDRQSIAGAIQTGTHGTGARFTGFAGMVRALRLALPDGSVVDTSPVQDPDLFEAARLGLGTLGVILEVTLACVPAYRLDLVESTQDLESTVGAFLADSSIADHHEFFWFPRTDRATVRTSRRVPQDTPRRRAPRPVEFLQSEVLGNGAWDLMCRGAAVAPRLSRPAAELASRLFAGPRVVDDSASVFTAPRRVRFQETEWAIPAARFAEAFTALRARFEDEGVEVTFPLEVRRVAADDVWMSTAYGRDTVYIAAHRHHREEAGPYLLMVQRTVESFGARPHWGKQHWLGASELSALYPRFEDFRAVRALADPDGVLMTPYLHHLLG
ncbi:D-arabinono-1,4-lactone oxidase [Brachybacterium sp. FME24]|uniref:D-arabinono-1,4-lactone oxidase n=1 Tax=Brachybacterium sp. FME24 TaxID=2742605 RepID=UPI0018671236|nr:D-arabinono-1,4-lactone oxidase [Brachybacterium sp. FME24]